MTPARSLAASVVALGFAGTLTAPSMPAYAAPAPCERAENYAGQSGAEMVRIEKLEVRTVAPERPAAEKGGGEAKDTTGRVLGAEEDPTAVDPRDSDTISEGVSMLGDAVLGSLLAETRGTGTGGTGGGAAVSEGDRAAISDVGVGEARTAMIANARVRSAALARMLAGRADGKAMTDPILQQAPPTNAAATRRGTPAGTAGPVSVGDGQIGAHARWAPGMACGVTVGEVARAETSQSSVSLLKGALVRAPEKLTAMSTTGLERRGGETRSVAAATVTAGRIELAGGGVRVRVLRAPMLTVGMSTRKGGEVRYVPAVVEVSGDGVGRQRLETAGDHVDVTLRPDRRALEDAVTALDGVRKAAPLPVPDVPGLPSLPGLPSPAEPRGESGSVTGAGTRVRISLGDVRQARKGHAIAARATAIKVSVVRSEAGAGHGSAAGSGPRSGAGYGSGSGGYGSGSGGYGSGSGGYGSMSLALGLGVLEAAAVAPDAVVAADRGASPEQVSAVAGAGGGLPITGPRAGLLALGGVGLLMTGIAAVLFGTRRRRY